MSKVQHTVTGVTGGSGGQVRFTWDNPDDASIDKYQYRYSTTSSSDGFFNWADVSGSSATTTSYPTGTGTVPIPGSSATLFYEFRAVNDDADIDSTAAVNEGGGPATAVRVDRSNTPVPTTAPTAAPTGLTATATPEQVKLDWTIGDSSDNITGYEYRQSSSRDSDGNAIWNPDWTEIGSSGASTITHTVSSLSDGTAYTFELRAKNSAGDGGAASVGPVTPGAPNAPTLNSATPTDDTTTAGVNEKESQIVLSWTAGADITDVEVDDYEYRTLVSGAASWTAWNSISGEGTETTYTVIDLLPSTTYSFQVRAVAGSLESDASDSASGKTADPPADQPLVAPDAPMGLRAAAGNEQATLTWSNPDNRYILRYRYRVALEGTVIDTVDWQQIDGSDKDTTSHTITGLINGTTYSFQVQAVGAGDNNLSDPSNTATATPRVPRPLPPPPPPPQPPATTAPTEPPPTEPPPTEPPPTEPPQGRSVTVSDPDGTIMTTVDKPSEVVIALLVDTESCGTEFPQGSLSLCLEIDATGPTEMLEDDPALITIHLSASRWSALRNAYLNGQFWVFKRSDAAAAWADIPACLNGATDECYEVTEYRNKSATVTIRNVRSLSQYAIAAVPPRSGGSGGGGSGGGSGRGSGGGSLARVTGTPAPTVPVIVPPTVRPTAVIPTPQPTVPPTPVPPTAVPPTQGPSTAVPPTALPPTPTEAPTPPVQVEAPTPPPPTPVDAPTLEPTEVTAALPPTAVAPAPTPIPPLVGEPEGNLPPWLLIVIIAAVLAVGGMGFLAFRLLRAQ